MSRSLKNALKAMAVLVAVTAVCVGALAVCNMFFPKYTPTLDAATAKLINAICPTGADDGAALADGYIVLCGDGDAGVTLADFNKAYKSDKAQVLAVYVMPKGEHAGAVIVEASSAGRDGDVVILTACADGAIVGATVKKQTESYWNKLPEDLFDALVGKKLTQTVNMKDELKQISADVHASYSMDAVSRAVNLSATFAAENGVGIEQYIEQTKGGDGQ